MFEEQNVKEIDPYEFDFRYPKKDLEDEGDGLYFPVDYNRLRELLDCYPYQAFELAMISNAIDLDTGKIKADFEQDNMVDYLEWQLLEVVNLVSNFGLSGGIAPYFFECLFPLLKQENIKPLTGSDWEWVDVSVFDDSPSGTKLQNRRFPAIFKDGSDQTAYWIMGKLFSDDGRNWYTKPGESRVEVSFPCITKKLESEYFMETIIGEDETQKGEE